jgi:ribosome-binding protein aMBF1 (putative translation factor)
MPTIPKGKLPPLELTDESIGERIARLRKHQGLTQQQLGEKIGISFNIVSDYERGRLRLYDEMVSRFALTTKGRLL